jgi:hypothetical protein
MRSLIFFLLFSSFFCTVNAAETDRPIGLNCQLEAPPENAGETINHGMTLRVHPRALNIDSKYTGCQLMWAQAESKWMTIAVVAIENGYPSRIWSPIGGEDQLLACRYKNGKVVVGDPKKCGDPDFLLMKSLAPGCVAMIQKKMALEGSGSTHPAGCTFE